MIVYFPVFQLFVEFERPKVSTYFFKIPKWKVKTEQDFGSRGKTDYDLVVQESWKENPKCEPKNLFRSSLEQVDLENVTVNAEMNEINLVIQPTKRTVSVRRLPSISVDWYEQRGYGWQR